MSVLIPPAAETAAQVAELTPRQIVAELDRYIVGQHDAKRAVAIAIRNRWRRQQLPDERRQDVAPKNSLMIGPTGVGKTESARRLAKLTGAPFNPVAPSTMVVKTTMTSNASNVRVSPFDIPQLKHAEAA